MIEWKNRCYIFFEGKHVLAPGIPYGQELALERICDDLRTVKPTMFVIFTHDTPPSEQIDISSCKVKRCRWRGKWIEVKGSITVKMVTDWFIKKYGEQELVNGK